MPSKKISFVIPVFNEAQTLEKLYREIKSAIALLENFKFEIIFVNDGSTDRSLEVIKNLRASDYRIEIISFRKNLGKSQALSAGFRKSTGDIIVTLDADLQDDPANLKNLLEKLDEGYDMVVGWKEVRLDPIDKTLPSRVFNFFTKTFSNIPIHDFNSGLKVIRKDVIKNLDLYGGLHRFIPILAAQRGFKVSEISVTHRPRKYGNSKYGAERLLGGFLDFLSVSFIGTYGQGPLQFFGLLGGVSILMGMIFGIYLSILHFMGQKIGDRPLLILSVLLILVGLQLFSLGFIAEMMIRKETKLDEKMPIEYETTKRR